MGWFRYEVRGDSASSANMRGPDGAWSSDRSGPLPRTRHARIVRIALCLPLLSALLSTTFGGVAIFRQDELECEEAMAHLIDCCPSSDFRWVSCEFVQGCSESTPPDLSPDESQCLRRLSCAEVRERGVCERVASRPTSVNEDEPEVCP
jgi:hypothetical protein